MRAHADALPMSAAYFSLILRGYGATPRHRAALLAGTGVADRALGEPSAEIALGQQLRQIQNANRLLDPGWALTLGARLHPATHGPIGAAVVSAPTMRTSVEVMARFSHVRSPHFRLRPQVDGDEVRLVPEDRVALEPGERRALLDIVLLSTQGLLESVLGRPMVEGRFEVPYRTPDHARAYRDRFHADVRFGRGEPAIVMPRAWLDFECPLADPVLFEASWRRLAAGARRLEGERFLPAEVEQIVAARRTRPRADAVARLLRLSRRTLTRRLRRSGTSYRDLLDASRRRDAESLLRDPGLTIAEVAYALGYEDAANFGRACRRWFGTSPGRERARLLAGD